MPRNIAIVFAVIPQVSTEGLQLVRRVMDLKKSKVENRWAMLNSWTSATETKKTYAEHFRTSSDIKLIKLKGSRHKGEVDDISIEFVFS